MKPAELMYPAMRSKIGYKPRPWKGVQNDSAQLAERALST
jgi:hypothetical protein